ncbi:MAG: LamG-like jellyroll fold domain-containing protein [Planctomycetota bacterium]|nr:LamG-like jellyroll fold domain-containing protein [Planctomycetota bacterium]
MKKTLTGLFCLLPTVVIAQRFEDIAAAIQPQDAKTDLRTFLQENGGEWQVEYNQATGTPKALYGPGLKLRGPVRNLEAARAQSEALLKRYGKLLGKGSSNFVETIGTKVNKVYVFVYDQKFNGLEVISGRADVRINDIGVVAMFGASAVAIPAGFNMRPAISSNSARTRADAVILGKAGAVNRPAPNLVIWADTDSKVKTTATLAWEVQINELPRQTAVGKAYIDAMTGALLQFKNEVFDCACGTSHIVGAAPKGHTKRMARSLDLATRLASPDLVTAPNAPKTNIIGTVMAWTNTGLNPRDPLVNVPLANVLVTSAVGRTFTDSAGNFSITYSGSTPQVVTATLTGRHCKRVRAAVGVRLSASATLTPGVSQAVQIGSSTMGQFDRAQTTTYWYTDDCNTWFRSLLGGSTAMDTLSTMNPRVNIASSCNSYYSSFTINFYQEGATCNMTAYSTVIEHEWGHGADDAFGGISQIDGLSEGWGDIIAMYRTGQPVVGANFRKNGSFIRTGLNTRKYPAGGSSQQQGQTWMGFAWDLWGFLRTSLGNGPGEDKAIDIVVKSIVANAANQPDAVREVFILDDDDGSLNNGTPNYDDLEKAAIKRTLPYPKRACGGAAAEMVYYNFDTGAGANAINRATGASTAMNGADPWTSPGKHGAAMLKGQSNSSATDFSYVETDFKGPIIGDLSIHWWMKERLSPGTALSYILGGMGTFRGFTGGTAGTEFMLRDWGGADLALPNSGADLQTRAQDANGVCVTLTIDESANKAQWYIDGAAHGASITIANGANVAAVTNGFRIGKHVSDTTCSVYDLDEFRMVNRVASKDEIAMLCDGPKSLYYKFDRGAETTAINYGDGPAPSTVVTAGGSAWESPGRYGQSMLRGSKNDTSSEYNYCDTGFTGPIHGGLTIAWWMKERNSPGTKTCYLWGGLGSMRCFTNSTAGTGLYVRAVTGSTDIKYTGDLQTAATAANGVHVALTIDATGKIARWYINGVPDGAACVPSGADVAAGSSSFKIGKHTSDSSSSCYDIDEFRLVNRCATLAEIKLWSTASTADVGLFGERCGLAVETLGGTPTVGNNDYTHVITATPAVTTSCLVVVGVLPAPSFDMGIAFPSLAGCQWFPSFDVQVAIPAAGGRLVIPSAVPNMAAAAGVHVFTQVLGVQGGTILMSNASDTAIEIN